MPGCTGVTHSSLRCWQLAVTALLLTADAASGTAGFCVPRAAGSCVGNLHKFAGRQNLLKPGGYFGFYSISAVDWDGDNDTDLVTGDCAGKVRFFERIADGSLEERIGAGRDPFHGITVKSQYEANCLAPFVVDWDGDGDLDLLVGSDWGDTGTVHFFEHAANGTWADHILTSRSQPDGIVVKSSVVPFAVDWDGDNDLDLILGDFGGDLHYFERGSDGNLTKRVGAGRTPFHGIDVSNGGTSVAPAAVDWDGDGDLDLIVCDSDGDLQFFQQVAGGSFEARRGGEANPFHGISAGTLGSFVLSDWDNDGDLDLLVGGVEGVNLFQRVKDDRLVERTGTHHNAFHDIDVGSRSVPLAFDWNGDGHLDLLVASFGGKLHYFEGAPDGSVSERTDDRNPFHAISIGYRAVPFVIDVNGDGLLDLVVGDFSGTLSLYEHLSDGSWVYRSGSANPYHAVKVPLRALPYVVDWDGDDRLDVIVGSWEGSLHFFQNSSDGSLVERVGAGQNPFHDIHVGNRAAPVAVDWDGDGDLDLFVGSLDGSVFYFERVSNGSLVMPVGADGNPLHYVQVGEGASGFGSRASPFAADCDGDGDLDLLVGEAAGTVHLFGHGFCKVLDPCSLQGQCSEMSGSCTCFEGFGGSGCSECKPGFYRTGRAFPVKCVACAHDRRRGLCAHRGQCWDDAAAHAEGNVSATLASLALGNGSCHCSDPSFGGLDAQGRVTCAQGSCPAGYEEMPSREASREAKHLVYHCQACTPGKYRNQGMHSCEECPAGRVAKGEDASECWRCPLGRWAAPGGMQCSTCDGGRAPNENQSGCDTCPAGTFADPGRATCTACPAGMKAAVASSQCSPCGHGSIPTEEKDACMICDEGTFSEWRGERCKVCPLGLHSSRASASCHWDQVMLFLAAGCFLAQAASVFLLLRWKGRRFNISDVSQTGDGAVVTTLEQHGVKVRLRQPTRLQLTGTGHPFLDDTRIFHARALDAHRLELLTKAGEHIHTQVDSSMGSLALCFPRDLLDTDTGLPVAVWSSMLLPVPWCIVLFCHVMGLMRSRAYPGLEYGILLGSTVSATILAAVLSAGLKWRSLRRNLTLFEQRRKNFQLRLHTRNPHPQPCEPGPGRAVTLEQIMEVLSFFHDFIQNRTAYYLNTNIIKPVTSSEQLSFAELAGCSRVDYFVSHFWGTPYVHFVESIKKHAQGVGRPDWGSIAYWICFYSNNQWNVHAEIGNGHVTDSSFYKCLHSGFCKATCMVLDSKALPLTRAWCLFEVLQTYRLLGSPTSAAGFQGLVFCTADGVLGDREMREGDGRAGCYDVAVALSHRLAILSVEDARATDPEDHRRIMQAVEEEGGIAGMNKFLRCNMWEALQTVQERFLHEISSLSSSLHAEDEEGSIPEERELALPAPLPTLLSSRPRFLSHADKELGTGDDDNV